MDEVGRDGIWVRYVWDMRGAGDGGGRGGEGGIGNETFNIAGAVRR